MWKSGLGLLLAYLATASVHASDLKGLRNLVERGGQGEFSCAFRKQTASKPCQVVVADEFSKHPGVMAFANSKKPVKIRGISIVWPDQSRSHYWFSDSFSMFNLDEEQGWGYDLRQLAGDEMAIDWRRGLIIEKDGKEHIRLW